MQSKHSKSLLGEKVEIVILNLNMNKAIHF